jgi:hypothetical protein
MQTPASSERRSRPPPLQPKLSPQALISDGAAGINFRQISSPFSKKRRDNHLFSHTSFFVGATAAPTMRLPHFYRYVRNLGCAGAENPTRFHPF